MRKRSIKKIGEYLGEKIYTSTMEYANGYIVRAGYVSINDVPDYLFEEEVSPEGDIRYRTCGLDRGSFWSEWRD